MVHWIVTSIMETSDDLVTQVLVLGYCLLPQFLDDDSCRRRRITEGPPTYYLVPCDDVFLQRYWN